MTHINPSSELQTAILFLVFNRPETTKQVFEAIRKVRPSRLYVAADGPREDRKDETEKVAVVRKIATEVNWPCEVTTLFRDTNLGCKNAVSGAIDWFFTYEERGIILEDDCLPHPDFFSFCQELLERYVNDESVAVITGNNFQNGRVRGGASYYFSKYNPCWGWATWRRAWQYYQGNLPFWPEWQRAKEWHKLTPDPSEKKYWSAIFDRVKREEIDSWAYPWTASVWFYGGLTATPNVNLVSNIGFGVDSTHTSDPENPHAYMATHALGLIRHPNRVEQDKQADRYVFDHLFRGKQKRVQYQLARLPRRLAKKAYRTLKMIIF